MSAATGLQTGLGDLGGAVGDIFASFGDFASAGAYSEAAGLENQAAQIAGQNANYAQESGTIQLSQAQRQITQAEGGQRADVAGAGFSQGGSAYYLMADTARQGGLQTGLIGLQTQMNVNSFQEQQLAFETQATVDQGLASAATAGGLGNIGGALLKGVAGIGALGLLR